MHPSKEGHRKTLHSDVRHSIGTEFQLALKKPTVVVLFMPGCTLKQLSNQEREVRVI